MAQITVEDGTAVEGANSYNSLATAEAFFDTDGKGGAQAAWTAASDDQRTSALLLGVQRLEGRWGPYLKGEIFSTGQGLLWPRLGVVVHGIKLLGSGDIPLEWTEAQLWLALYHLQSSLAATVGRDDLLKRKRIEGVIDKEWDTGRAPADRSYPFIDQLVWPYLDGAPGMQFMEMGG